jgi:hypothetical protein
MNQRSPEYEAEMLDSRPRRPIPPISCHPLLLVQYICIRIDILLKSPFEKKTDNC